jgi:hypothetical protein
MDRNHRVMCGKEARPLLTPGPGWLSFRRIVDIPFEACVSAFESWRLHGHDGELQVGKSWLRGPIEHDRGSGTCRVKIDVAQGPLRPLLRMRLDVDCWSSPSSTALELIPCGRVRATASYFRVGHLLLDSLTLSLELEQQIQALELPARQGRKPAPPQPRPWTPAGHRRGSSSSTSRVRPLWLTRNRANTSCSALMPLCQADGGSNVESVDDERV